LSASESIVSMECFELSDCLREIDRGVKHMGYASESWDLKYWSDQSSLVDSQRTQYGALKVNRGREKREKQKNQSEDVQVN
jgi:hypothetical protein